MSLVSIPRDLVCAPELAGYDRGWILLWLVAQAAPREGLYRHGPTVARLRRGELLGTHESFGQAWSRSGGEARKVLDALKRCGALDWSDVAPTRVRGFPPPVGTLFRIPWID